MQLTIDNVKTIDNPTKADIQALLSANFVVLERNPDLPAYMQFMQSRKRGIQLEYQEGAIDNHFTASDQSLTMERVIEALQKYAVGDESWKTDFQWKRLDLLHPEPRE